MDKEAFVKAVEQGVRDSGVKGLVSTLADPPGRWPDQWEIERSAWYNQLSSDDKANIKTIIEDAIDTALFGVFAVLDGVRVIEPPEHRGHLVLLHCGEEVTHLNDPNKIDLHDLYHQFHHER